MSTTTPEPYPIWYPEASDPIAPLHSAFATLADSVYDSFDENLTPIVNRLQTANYSVDTVTAMNALTSVIPGSNAYVIATKSRYSYDGTSWIPVYVPWTTYTPTAVTGFTFNTARYTISNNIVNVNIKMTKNSTPTTGLFTSLQLTLPVSSSSVVDERFPVGLGSFRKDTTIYPLRVFQMTTSSIIAYYENSSPLKFSNVDANFAVKNKPAEVATGNYFTLNFSYAL
jgi:hypothetical protein